MAPRVSMNPNCRVVGQTKPVKGMARVEEGKLENLARITPAFNGADIANMINEAALLASRDGKDAVTAADFDSAIERIVAGSERRTRAMNEREKRTVAVHEAGHALVAGAVPFEQQVAPNRASMQL